MSRTWSECSREQAGLTCCCTTPTQSTRYEVELQCATDETHIIRTIEYWDIERRRFPEYDHVAVIVVEEITARFFNVIGLFNGVDRIDRHQVVPPSKSAMPSPLL